MGGAEKIMAKGKELIDSGKYLEASEILNKLVYAQPQNQAGKDLLADVFEQIGYQQENPGLRNSFLAAAYELRSGIPATEAVSSSSPDVIRAMSTELFLNFLGIRMDSVKAEGMRFTINLITPDNGEKFLIEMENATLTNIQGFLSDKPDLTLTINRADLENTMMGAKTLDAQIADGTAKAVGDAGVLKQLASTMVDFDPRFPIMPGTKLRGTGPEDGSVRGGAGRCDRGVGEAIGGSRPVAVHSRRLHTRLRDPARRTAVNSKAVSWLCPTYGRANRPGAGAIVWQVLAEIG